jgi:hypothetical protein
VRCELATSKGEARRFIEQGGVYVNNVRVESERPWTLTAAARSLRGASPRPTPDAPRGRCVIRARRGAARGGPAALCVRFGQPGRRCGWVKQSGFTRTCPGRSDSRRARTPPRTSATTALSSATTCTRSATCSSSTTVRCSPRCRPPTARRPRCSQRPTDDFATGGGRVLQRVTPCPRSGEGARPLTRGRRLFSEGTARVHVAAVELRSAKNSAVAGRSRGARCRLRAWPSRRPAWRSPGSRGWPPQ